MPATTLLDMPADDDPQRIEHFGLIRFHHDDSSKREELVFADKLDIHLLPKVGAQWMPHESRYEVMAPGKNEKHYLAGALETSTGDLYYTLGDRNNNGLCRDLLDVLDHTYPASRIDRIDVVVDNYMIHKAKAVHQWLEKHPRFELLGLPTYGPKANPIGRAFGDVHDTVPAIITASAYVIWSRILSMICRPMGPGNIKGLSFTMTPL